MVEKWKKIKNYTGYEVSNFGRVRTHNKISFVKKHGVRHWKDRILKLRGSSKCGNRIVLWNREGKKEFLVARLVAFTFFDKDINNKELTVNHIDGNRFNNHINNLELISLKENIQHGFKTGLYDSFQKKVKLINKSDNNIIIFNNLSNASKYLGKSNGYLSNSLNKKKFENETYRWELC